MTDFERGAKSPCHEEQPTRTHRRREVAERRLPARDVRQVVEHVERVHEIVGTARHAIAS